MEIISAREVETQEELAHLLCRAGFNVTQATVSRDIKQLNLRKVPSASGRQCYAAAAAKESFDGDRLAGILRAGFVSMEAASNILVIKTVSGMAMAACAALDAFDWPEMLGTIAGDDTIFAVVRNEKETAVLLERIRLLSR